MHTSLWRGPERRRDLRMNAAFAVHVEIEVYGFDGRVRPFFASGFTNDISMLGLQADLDAPVSRGSVCSVYFRGVGEQLRPHHVTGRVVRADAVGNRVQAAIEFDEPLLRLRGDQLAKVAVNA